MVLRCLRRRVAPVPDCRYVGKHEFHGLHGSGRKSRHWSRIHITGISSESTKSHVSIPAEPHISRRSISSLFEAAFAVENVSIACIEKQRCSNRLRKEPPSSWLATRAALSRLAIKVITTTTGSPHDNPPPVGNFEISNTLCDGKSPFRWTPNAPAPQSARITDLLQCCRQIRRVSAKMRSLLSPRMAANLFLPTFPIRNSPELRKQAETVADLPCSPSRTHAKPQQTCRCGGN